MNTTKITAPDGASGDNFGGSVSVHGSTIVVGAGNDDDDGTNSGSAYIFDTAGNYITKITAPDGAVNDNFGNSVAIYGSTIVVGSHHDDDNAINSGSAYIFDTSGNYITKITAPDAAAGDLFGYSVSVHGSIIVIGARNDDDNGTDSGSAYIFDTSGNYLTKIIAPDGVPGDDFGSSVAVYGSKVVVGAIDNDDSGSAYIFTLNLSQILKIAAPDGEAYDQFGNSVAIYGSTIVVGSHSDKYNGNASGSAYIFDTSGNYLTKIRAPDAGPGDLFGYSVSVHGSTIVISARNDDDNGPNSGSAYIFDTSGNYITKITAPDGAANDFFGYSVSVYGSTIVVGAFNDDDNGNNSGSAYIFDTAGNYITKITAPDGEAGDRFGCSVSVYGSTIVVGAFHDDDNGSNSGSAYIFNTAGNYITKITAPDGEADDNFGCSVAVNGLTIVVGANYDDDNGSNSGSAYIFDTAGSYITKITAPDAAADDFFGVSVSVYGSTIVVGSYGDDDAGSISGSVYIFDTAGNYLTKITAPDGASYTYFGKSVAIYGTAIIVASEHDNYNGDESGSAYIFEVPPS